MEEIESIENGQGEKEKIVKFNNGLWVVVDEYKDAKGGMVVQGRTLLEESDFEMIEKKLGYKLD